MSRYEIVSLFMRDWLGEVKPNHLRGYLADEIIPENLEILSQALPNPAAVYRVSISDGGVFFDSYATLLNLFPEDQEARCILNASAALEAFGYLGEIGQHENGTARHGSLKQLAQSCLILCAYGAQDLNDYIYTELELLCAQNKFVDYLSWAPDEPIPDYAAGAERLLPFYMEMMAASQGKTIDWDSFNIRADRFYLDFVRV